jgi:hypothetical protein
VTSDDHDDPKLRSMRAVWLQMRDEDPPAGGLSELLAAARAKADTMAAAEPSWWQRLVAMLRRPPVFALATVMIVLGGALLIGRRIEPAASPPPRLETRSSDEPIAGRAQSTEHLASPPPVLDREIPTAPLAHPHGNVAHSAPPPESPPPLEMSHSDPGATADVETASGEADGRAGMKSSMNGEVPAAPPTAQTDSTEPLDQLRRQCDTAARRGDCAAVRAMVERIERSDRSFRARVVKDSPVAKCLAK